MQTVGMSLLYLASGRLGDTIDHRLLSGPLLVSGFGMGIAISSLFQVVLASVGHRDAGSGSGALQSFQLGRYPEAYGRFVALANAGHPGAARQALWMCEHGPALFGRQWDCGPQQVTDWAAAARDATVQLPAYDEKPARDATAAGRRR